MAMATEKERKGKENKRKRELRECHKLTKEEILHRELV